MIEQSLIEELFLGCHYGKGKPLRDGTAPQGQKLLEAVRILRPKGVTGGIVPKSRENSSFRRRRTDRNQGLR